jgi:DNA-binding MarR family transcriptional regulator
MPKVEQETEIKKPTVRMGGGQKQGKAELVEEIIQLQRQVNRALRQGESDVWMELSLTIAQLKSLFFISNEGSTNFTKLAQALRVTPSNVTGIIDRLVGQGLVSRRENPENRRMLVLQSTDRGEALLASLRERKIGQLSEMLSRLSEEQLSTLAQGLRFLVEAAEASQR